ncbi:methyltransferase domain-containing protein [Glycomyces sp. TRM65418]|uniref:putative RNA methyltransferase n=1 Tax=Glycomyces sp. TRM65418 TaxID=2867006 RepID=UPI001CE5A977|nr:methyltransferase domain-containing protein [Glycomyces sp. TRM65418]MCC3762312.1 methyltransferase domain-containing protein [Glycomyces sp. TRM65418]QZD56366.1 methyltransferase domain-containing protein [Glycomyces sp. TRM65418]
MTHGPETLPALAALACPNCGQALDQAGRRLSCPAGHSFDLAKQGYAPLLAPGSNATTGDTADQVAAREDFLGSGVYDPLMAAVANASLTDAPGVIVEPGCGTGHYLAAALAADASREGIGLDTSKYALRRCARRLTGDDEPRRAAGTRWRLAAVLADAWRTLPIRDDAAAAVLNVFAPRNADEIARILHPGGVLVVLTPRQDHLRELVDALDLLSVDPAKPQRTADQLGSMFEAERTDELHYPIGLGRTEILKLVGMGPSARHLDPAALAAAVAALPDKVEVTVAATVTRWRGKGS